MASAQKPRLRLRKATPTDVPDIVRVHAEAFGPGIMDHIMYPGGFTEDARAKFGATFFPAPDPSKPSSGETIIVVVERAPEDGVDDAPGEIVAFGKWIIYRGPRPEEEWNVAAREMTQEMLGEGADLVAYKAFIADHHYMRKKAMKGDPALYLNILACTPKHGRLGAGSTILRWGSELADKEGLVAWLEASPQGFPLYSKFGFKAVDVQDLEITERFGAIHDGVEDWGTNSAVDLAGPLPKGVFRTVMMRREPQAVPSS
ncbi:hypothetical protein NKR23_g216 [Pleurostoma richardsiae]|uniref:N-acetyltransferase domain-containing protein n=1 Tax=Pleurostoma richardsiae TaxID=41990 RepID=A0AA38VQP2_9PEZI|nr:hypothetical protein NKR23_g216 [Pleurostoma richardsiae]